jgi:hypothetical protein
MALSHSPSIVTNGLVLCLDAGNPKSYAGIGTVWTDLSGQGNNGTLVNGPTYSSSNGGSIVFDGGDDIVSISDSNILDITTSISLESWIYATKSTGIQNVISKSSASQNNSYIYPRTDDGWTTATFYLGVPIFTTLIASWPSRDAWHHTVATYDGATMKIYIDGVLSNSKSQSGTISTNTNSLTIGSQPGYGEYYGGRVSGAKIYNRALTASEIQQNYNALRSRFGI